MIRIALVLVAILVGALPARAGTVLFDFDSGSPTLHPTLPLPHDQTAGGVTAGFTGRFSI